MMWREEGDKVEVKLDLHLSSQRTRHYQPYGVVENGLGRG